MLCAVDAGGKCKSGLEWPSIVSFLPHLCTHILDMVLIIYSKYSPFKMLSNGLLYHAMCALFMHFKLKYTSVDQPDPQNYFSHHQMLSGCYLCGFWINTTTRQLTSFQKCVFFFF